MRPRLGPGPVFAYEWLMTTRRWQLYAVRAGFVGAILVGMMFVWQRVSRPEQPGPDCFAPHVGKLRPEPFYHDRLDRADAGAPGSTRRHRRGRLP